MKFAVAFALAALSTASVAAYADQAYRIVARHHGPLADMDANHDGWITRSEAAAGADRTFDELDTNRDGRLTDADRPRMTHDVDVRIEGPEGIPAPDERNCTRTAEGNRVTIICNGGGSDHSGERHVIVRRDHPAPHAEAGHHVEQEVTIITSDDGSYLIAPEAPEAPETPPAPEAPLAPLPPHPPMFMMLMANSDEMDTNHDGAISREEFRAQQLRFFHASDANGDGRIRFEPPPEPPLPPAAPTAPMPPRPPR